MTIINVFLKAKNAYINIYSAKRIGGRGGGEGGGGGGQAAEQLVQIAEARAGSSIRCISRRLHRRRLLSGI